MAWWTNPNVHIKQKDKFIVAIGEYLIPTVVSCDKPKITIDKKEYTMINQVYRYPGIAKWQPVTIRFVDGSANGVSIVKFNGEDFIEPLAGIDNLDAAQMLSNMLFSSGYNSPMRGRDASTSKAAMMDASFGGSVRIEQLEPDGDRISEGWQLFNPIISEVSWGSLDYGSTDAVEYSITIEYDYAEMYIGESKASKGYYNHIAIHGKSSSLRKADREEFKSLGEAKAKVAEINRQATEARKNEAAARMARVQQSWTPEARRRAEEEEAARKAGK